jgi:spore germination cell wall hydrolase CwlJ-like protein
MPKTLSEQIAYARADAPVTVFDGTVKARSGKKVSAKELNCMATAIYFEARGESYRGQVAVAQVVQNRVSHKLYPDTICSVVYQNKSKRNACQFSFACDGIPERVYDKKAWAQAEEIAKGVVAGDLYLTEVGYATHYHATYVRPHWAPRMKKVTKVGLHVFYQFKRGWKFG